MIPFFWRATFYGLFAAVAVAIPRYIWLNHLEISFIAPFAVLVLTVLVVIANQFFKSRAESNYQGIADLLLHIHESPYEEAKERWWLRGFSSMVLSIFGIKMGPEGAAMEGIHAAAVQFRSSESSWFEQQRRTDVACAMAAGISAAFGTPFAALVLPIEMRIGGNLIPVVLSAVSAAFFSANFERFLPLQSISLVEWTDGFDAEILLNWKFVVTALTVGMVCAVIAAGMIFFIRIGRDSIDRFFPKSQLIKTIFGSCLIVASLFALQMEHLSLFDHLQNLVALDYNFQQTAVYFTFSLLVFSLVMVTFGGAGVFWPLFVIGAFIGYGFGSLNSDVQIFATLVGAASFLSAALGIPITATLIVTGMTQNQAVIFPVLLGTVIAWGVMKIIKSPGMLEENLRSRGLSISSGQSKTVLERIKIKRVMVKDFVSVRDHDRLEALKEILATSKYPFLPVTNSKKKFVGLLSAGMIEEAEEHGKSARLLEAKDLLYRNKQELPFVSIEDDLTHASGIFTRTPVVPVLDEKKEVVGLLFTHHVRIAYDQEVAKRSLAYIAREFRRKK